jgi:hypothetical protein
MKGGGRARARGARGHAGRRSPRWRWVPAIVGLLVAVVMLASRGGAQPRTVTHAGDETVARTNDDPRWRYTNPLRAASDLQTGRIDMGADYRASGPILALGKGTVTFATDHDTGPPSCWGRTCWPAGGIVVYRLSEGPFAGKYVYVAEKITVSVSVGETVKSGQQIAIAHVGYPDIETGWASGKGPETLAIADRHECPCGDPGGWSTIEGRNFDQLLVVLGAPSAQLQPNPPNQSMPPGWPTWPSMRSTAPIPRSPTRLPEGSTTRSTKSQAPG